MENFERQVPIITERNKQELDGSSERLRQLLSNEIDYTAEILQEFATPDYEHQSCESFQMFDDKYYRGSFDCTYQNGDMQNATIELKARENHLDATLAYDQDRDAWQLHTLESDKPRLVPTLAIMKSIITPPHYTERMVNAQPSDISFDDLIELFAKKSKGFVDKKSYISVRADMDNLSTDSMSETATVLEVSSSLDPAKNYNSLEVIHRTTDFDDENEPATHVDKEYRLSTGKNNVGYIERGMTSEEAGQHLLELRNEKNFANL